MKNLRLLLLISVLAAFSAACGDGKPANQPGGKLPVKLPAAWSNFYQTPKGVKIQTVTEIPSDRRTDVFAAIDQGITYQLAATGAKFPHWRAARGHSDYNLLFIAPDAQNADGSPALNIYGTQSAGTVIGVGNDGINPSFLVLPHQGASGWQFTEYLKNSVWHESEHFAEWANDYQIFWQYAGPWDEHPHHPLPAGESAKQ